jgi:hypothetical protein
MTTKLVPDDLFMKHENEWQALRQIADNTADIQRIDIRSAWSLGMRERSPVQVGGQARAAG